MCVSYVVQQIRSARGVIKIVDNIQNSGQIHTYCIVDSMIKYDRRVLSGDPASDKHLPLTPPDNLTHGPNTVLSAETCLGWINGLLN